MTRMKKTEYLLNGEYVLVVAIGRKTVTVRPIGQYHRAEAEFIAAKSDLIAFSRYYPPGRRQEISDAEARRIERCQMGIHF